MLKATWKSLLGHKARMLMSGFAIVLGIAFVAGSLIFTDLLSQSINGLMKGTLPDVTISAKPQEADDQASPDAVLPTISSRELAKIRDVAGVASVDGNNLSQSLYPLNGDGKPISSQSAPTITSNFFEAPAADGQIGIEIKSGRAPRAGEAMLDPTALALTGHQVGDTLTVADVSVGDQLTFTIVGTATWGSGATFGSTYMFIDNKTSQELFTQGKDAYLQGWVATESGADPAVVAEEIGKILPGTMEAVDADTAAAAAQERLNAALAFVNTFLMVFAFISLVVAMFLIWNTFSIIVAQRGRELALLRAMGASRKQILGSVVLEATVVGFFGAALGIGAGWLLAGGIGAVMDAVGFGLGGSAPALPPVVALVSYPVGVFVTVIAACVPAVRASKIPPVAAMTGDYATGKEGLGKLTVVALSLITVGGGVMAGGLFGWLPEAVACVGVGALLILLGVAGASPLFGRPVTWIMGVVYRLVFGAVGRLAELNASRNPRRTAATASALMIGLALVVTMAILGQSAKTSVAGLVATSFRGQLQVSSPVSPVETSVGDKIEKVEGVAEIHRFRNVIGKVGDENSFVAAMEPRSFDKMFEQVLVEGDVSNEPFAVLASRDWAESRGSDVGDSVPVVINGQTEDLQITGVFSVSDAVSGISLVTNFNTFAALGVEPMDAQYSVHLEPGQDVAKVKERVEDVVASMPLVGVQDLDDITEQMNVQVDVLLAIIYALLALSVVIAVLGIVNTLALSVIERTREIGLLRAVGLTRGQLRRMVTLESVVVSLLGAVLGVGMGFVFGVALQRPLADQGLDKLDVPWDLLGVFLLVSIVIGVLAALWPARRAAKQDVLRAIATD